LAYRERAASHRELVGPVGGFDFRYVRRPGSILIQSAAENDDESGDFLSQNRSEYAPQATDADHPVRLRSLRY